MARFDPFGSFAAKDQEIAARRADASGLSGNVFKGQLEEQLNNQLHAQKLAQLFTKGGQDRTTELVKKNIPEGTAPDIVTATLDAMRGLKMADTAGSAISSARDAGRQNLDPRAQDLVSVALGRHHIVPTKGEAQEAKRFETENQLKQGIKTTGSYWDKDLGRFVNRTEETSRTVKGKDKNAPSLNVSMKPVPLPNSRTYRPQPTNRKELLVKQAQDRLGDPKATPLTDLVPVEGGKYGMKFETNGREEWVTFKLVNPSSS